jgi:microcystin-dependent protein
MNEDAVLGEIRLWAGSFLPTGWLYCDGSVLPITPSGKSQDPLYAVLKSQFGGDGVKTFALPKLADVVLPKGSLRYTINRNGPAAAAGLAGLLTEVRIFTSAPPSTYVECLGQLMVLSNQAALFSLLQANYGGDGIHNFGLPHLPALTAVHGPAINYSICINGTFPENGGTFQGYVGSVRNYAGSVYSIPVNWPQCNGQSVNVSGNNNAVTVINYEFGGSGDEMTMPNIPPLASNNTTTVVPYIMCVDGLLPTS